MALGFEHPFTCTIAGPTKSGKTSFVQKLLKAVPFYITPCPTRIVWSYGIEDSNQIETIKNNIIDIPIEFHDSIPALDIFSPEDNNLLIIDDLMNDAGKSSIVSNLFTKGSHHRNVSIILILQNLFHQGKKMRDIHTSTNYLILFNNPRDKSQIKYLARQTYPDNPNFVIDAYKQACQDPFGYLVLDFTQTTPDYYRLSSGIFPPHICQLYQPKKT